MILRTGKNQVVERDPKTGKFIKGQSGNPGGRTKGVSITALIDKAVTENDWVEIIKILYTRAKRGDLKAIEMLMDRRFGKAKQPLTGEDGEGLKILVEYVNSPYSVTTIPLGASRDLSEPE